LSECVFFISEPIRHYPSLEKGQSHKCRGKMSKILGTKQGCRGELSKIYGMLACMFAVYSKGYEHKIQLPAFAIFKVKWTGSFNTIFIFIKTNYNATIITN